jgi:GNAT superfamily N-acetyltransferase
MHQLHRLPDGSTVLLRDLLPDDRDELRQRYEELSENSRRLRFFSAPTHLSDRLLDRLLDVDQVDRAAIVAVMVDEPGSPAVGIARYVRSRERPECADAAVTVIDTHQRRGIGTLLLRALTDMALDHGVTTLTGDVMWENEDLLNGLRAVGASVRPGEPGRACVSIDLTRRLRSARRGDGRSPRPA